MPPDVMVRLSKESKVKFDRVKEKLKNDLGEISNSKVFISALNAYYEKLFNLDKNRDRTESKIE